MGRASSRVGAWLAGFPGGRRGGAVVVVLALLAIAYTVATAPFGADYARPDCGCDDSGPAISSLAHGRFREAAERQPLMGPLSLLARAPFAAVAYATGGDDYDAYKLGLVPCLLVLAALGAFVVRRLPDNRFNQVAAPVVAVLFVINPAVSRAVHFGHPEEFLAAALAVFGVIAALDRRPLLAGLLLAAAFASKQWAVLAVFVAVAVRPEQSVRLLAGALVGVVAVYLPAIVGDASRLRDVWQHGGYQLETSANGGAPGVRSTNVWWPFVTYTGTRPNGAAAYALPVWLDRYTRVILVGVGLLVCAAVAAVHRGRPSRELLLLVGFVFLLRCLLDPYNNSYYNVGFVIALGAYEVYARRRVPWVAIAAGAALGLTVKLADDLDADGLNRLYLAWTLPLAAYMAVRLFVPAGIGALGRRAPIGGEPAKSGGAIRR